VIVFDDFVTGDPKTRSKEVLEKELAKAVSASAAVARESAESARKVEDGEEDVGSNLLTIDDVRAILEEALDAAAADGDVAIAEAPADSGARSAAAVRGEESGSGLLGDGGFGRVYELKAGDATRLAKLVEGFFRFEGCGGNQCAFGAKCLDRDAGECEVLVDEEEIQTFEGQNGQCSISGQVGERLPLMTVASVPIPGYGAAQFQMSPQDGGDNGAVLALDLGAGSAPFAKVRVNGFKPVETRSGDAGVEMLVGGYAGVSVIMRGGVYFGGEAAPGFVVEDMDGNTLRSFEFEEEGEVIVGLRFRWVDRNKKPVKWGSFATTPSRLEIEVLQFASDNNAVVTDITRGEHSLLRSAAPDDGIPIDMRMLREKFLT
jgi:hypothetical protein